MPTARREIELDFIRGIAILLVLDFHFAPREGYLGHASILLYPLRFLGVPHFGWAGVDIFFVLSGFLVGGLLIKERLTRGSINSRRFILRRAFKIWPQYYFFLAVMLALHPRAVRSYIGNLLNIQNYTGTPLQHTWSLAVEEHFYLILVALLAVVVMAKLSTRSLAIVLALAATTVTLYRTLAVFHGEQNYYRTHLRIDALLFGVLLAIIYHHRPRFFARLQQPRWLLAMVPGAAIISTHWQSPFARSLGIFAADAAGVALLLLFYRHRPHRSFAFRATSTIGLYSYGVYLWHESVLGPVSSMAMRIPRVAPVFLAITPWVLAIALGIVTTYLIERPALRLRERLFPRTVDSAAGVPAISEVPPRPRNLIL